MAIDYKITERIAELGDRSGGWKLELNKVSWNGKAAKYDIPFQQKKRMHYMQHSERCCKNKPKNYYI